ncbi:MULTISPECIES: hypothetical protein [unclassified Mycoplasma]|uniref:hypothetical protein n=1 Tax=unclassified Mycoplasma TaxID=2683645 RepID=UPI00211BAB4F|nr:MULTISPECIES: hypothetical protein [unclassified Mycoplasma]UUM19581.1 hypothetical protein NPA11_02280 [Mycoplasma sp. 1578d]UUM24500.1 hypothetical protein NPA12_02255 [Mycoplasma sp. 3686d]
MQSIHYNYFVVERNEDLTPSDQENILNFYLPIIGSQAVTLYNFLYNKIKVDKLYHSEYAFSGICSFLSVKMDELSQSRSNLEAIGLIKTYFNEKTNKLMFLIKRPLNKEEVKSNRLLKNALINCLGKDIVDNLLASNVIKRSVPADYMKDISANFIDVFGEKMKAPKSTRSIDLVIEAGKRIEQSIQNNSFSSFKNIELKMPLHFLDQEIRNEYQALQTYEPLHFYNFLSKNQIQDNANEVIKEFLTLGFDNKVINLVMLISFLNKNIVELKQVNSILKELSSKKIFSFEIAENYLDGKYSDHKIYHKSIKSKNYIKKLYLNSI